MHRSRAHAPIPRARSGRTRTRRALTQPLTHTRIYPARMRRSRTHPSIPRDCVYPARMPLIAHACIDPARMHRSRAHAAAALARVEPSRNPSRNRSRTCHLSRTHASIPRPRVNPVLTRRSRAPASIPRTCLVDPAHAHRSRAMIVDPVDAHRSRASWIAPCAGRAFLWREDHHASLKDYQNTTALAPMNSYPPACGRGPGGRRPRPLSLPSRRLLSRRLRVCLHLLPRLPSGLAAMVHLPTSPPSPLTASTRGSLCGMWMG